jgi:hypothetical protein
VRFHFLVSNFSSNFPTCQFPLRISCFSRSQTAIMAINGAWDAPYALLAGDFTKFMTDKGITFIEKILSDGRGIRLNQDYTFKGFID